VCQFDFIVGIESDLEFAVVGDAVWLDRHSDVAVGMAEIEVRLQIYSGITACYQILFK